MTGADRLLAEVAALYREDPPGSGLYGNGEPITGPWWSGTCHDVVAAADEAGLLARHGGQPVWWGAFDDGSGHCWIDVEGAIVDPTVRQFGPHYPENGWVIHPGDPRQALYHQPA